MTMRFIRLLSVSLVMTAVSVATETALPQECPHSAEHRLIVGWDDAVIVCGPGTTAGMDSPEAIEQMVKRWKARGYRGVYWRVDEAMLPARFMNALGNEALARNELSSGASRSRAGQVPGAQDAAGCS